MKKNITEREETSQEQTEPFHFEDLSELPLLHGPFSQEQRPSQRIVRSSRERGLSFTLSGLVSELIGEILEPILQVTDGQGKLNPFAVHHNLAAMVYPRDPSAQDEFLATVKAADLSENMKSRLLEDDTIALVVSKVIAEHGGFKTLARAPGVAAIQERTVKGARKGIIAGAVLVAIAQLALVNPSPSVNKAIFLLEQDPKGIDGFQGGKGPRSGRRIHDAWEEYKPVAHLWAAMKLWSRTPGGERPGFGPSAFSPYQNASLPAFLAHAEIFRLFGSWLYPHGQTAPFLSQSETWKPPSDLRLPETSVTFLPMAEWAVEALKKYKAPRRDY